MFSITVIIVAITSLVSIFAFRNQRLMDDFIFWPAEIKSRKQYYRFFSVGLVHVDTMHLVFNMYSLYSIGEFVERYSFSQFEIFGIHGKVFFLVLYISSLFFSGIPDYINNRNNFGYRAAGASGAVSAVVFALIILQPKISLGFFFIPMPGYVFGVLYLAISAYLAKKGSDNIGHLAHFSGAIYGLLFVIVATKLYSGYDAIPSFFRMILHPR